MKRILPITNGIAFISTIIINYLSNTGILNGSTIGTVSSGLQTLFTPASYAFSIWGFIYLLLFGFIFFQGRSLFSNKRPLDLAVDKMGWWFVISCIANSGWIFLWIYGLTGLSCIFILLLLFSLMQIIFRSRLALDSLPFSRKLLISWPFVIYAGWVTVASVANISAYLHKINWNRMDLQPDTWAIIMIVVAVAINIWAVHSRNLTAFALVGAWALIAIGIRNQETYQNVSNIAYLGALILIIDALISTFLLFKKNKINAKN